MSKMKDVWEKFKNIKHIQIVCAVVVALVLCVAYFALWGGSKDDSKAENSTEEFSSAEEYVSSLENKLCNVLSKISGVGEVSVVITLESGFTFEYATDKETNTVVSGGTETSITTETVILVSGEPVVIKQNYPVIKGVVIVAKGAENFSVKMDILSATQTALQVDQQNITILA